MTSRIERESVNSMTRPIDTKSLPSGRRKAVHQSPHIILVHIVGFRVPAGALFELRLEPGFLIVGVVELAEAVRNLPYPR